MAPKAPTSSPTHGSPEYKIQPLTAGVPAKLTRTPEGWRVFETIFQASMSQELRHFVQNIPSGQMKPYDDDQRLAFETIYNGMILRLQHDPDLINLVCEQVETGNGIQALSVLRSKFRGNSAAKSLTIIGEISTKKLVAPDVLVGAQRMVTLNDQLASDEQFPDQLLSAFIVLKLPNTFSHLRDSAVASGTFPSISNLMDSIEQIQLFSVASSAASKEANFSEKKMFCFNCDTPGHTVRTCKEPKLDCDVCGAGAGHMAKHCLAKSDKEIPVSFSSAHRAAIERNRAKYQDMIKAGTAAAVTVCKVCPPATSEYPSAWDNNDEHVYMPQGLIG